MQPTGNTPYAALQSLHDFPNFRDRRVADVEVGLGTERDDLRIQLGIGIETHIVGAVRVGLAMVVACSSPIGDDDEGRISLAAAARLSADTRVRCAGPGSLLTSDLFMLYCAWRKQRSQQ